MCRIQWLILPVYYILGFGLSLDNELGKIESNVFETFSTLETLPAGEILFVYETETL